MSNRTATTRTARARRFQRGFSVGMWFSAGVIALVASQTYPMDYWLHQVFAVVISLGLIVVSSIDLYVLVKKGG